MILERVKGIEPSLFAWEAKVLPLNDTRPINAILPVRKKALNELLSSPFKAKPRSKNDG